MDRCWLVSWLSVKRASTRQKMNLAVWWSLTVLVPQNLRMLWYDYILLHAPSLIPQKLPPLGIFLGNCWEAVTRVSWEKWTAGKVFYRYDFIYIYNWFIKSKHGSWTSLWFCQLSLLKWINCVFHVPYLGVGGTSCTPCVNCSDT